MNKQEPEVIAFSKDVPHQQYSADPVEREEDEIMEDEDEFESEIEEKILDLDETDDEETVLKVRVSHFMKVNEHFTKCQSGTALCPVI